MATVAKVELAKQVKKCMPKQKGKNERDKTNPKNNRQREKKERNK